MVNYPIRTCKNHKCTNYMTIIGDLPLRGPHRCPLCRSKLKPVAGVIDGLPPGDQRSAIMTNGNGGTRLVPINAKPRVKLEMYLPHEKAEALTFNEFPGSYEAYKAYRKFWDEGKRYKIMPRGKDFITNTDLPAAEGAGSDTFTCNDSNVEGCPLQKNKADVCRVHVPYAIYVSWFWLAKCFDTEWIAYLKGAQNEEGVWVISDMYFPNQKANGSHVDVEGDDQIQPGTIGDVHSHVGMGAFFSVEDKRHWNHDVHIVVNRKFDHKIALRETLECGRSTRIETEKMLLLAGPPANLDFKALLAELDDKLKEDKRGVSTSGTPSSSRESDHYYKH